MIIDTCGDEPISHRYALEECRRNQLRIMEANKVITKSRWQKYGEVQLINDLLNTERVNNHHKYHSKGQIREGVCLLIVRTQTAIPISMIFVGSWQIIGIKHRPFFSNGYQRKSHLVMKNEKKST